MLQYESGRVCFDVIPGSLSFRIPDGFWMNTESEGSANYISLYTEDRSAEIDIFLRISTEKEMGQELISDFAGIPAEELDGPYILSEGKIPGCDMFCTGEIPEFAAILDIGRHRLAAGDGYADRLMVTIAMVEKGKNREDLLTGLREIVRSDSVKELLKSIQVGRDRVSLCL